MRYDLWWALDADHRPRKATSAEYLEWTAAGFDVTRKVARTEVGEASVSTVFLSIDHAFGDGPPTCSRPWSSVARTPTGPTATRTWDEAVAGHERVVAAITEGRDP